MTCVLNLLQKKAKDLEPEGVDEVSGISFWGDAVPYSNKKSPFLMSMCINPTATQARYPLEKDSEFQKEALGSVAVVLLLVLGWGFSRSPLTLQKPHPSSTLEHRTLEDFWERQVHTITTTAAGTLTGFPAESPLNVASHSCVCSKA